MLHFFKISTRQSLTYSTFYFIIPLLDVELRFDGLAQDCSNSSALAMEHRSLMLTHQFNPSGAEARIFGQTTSTTRLQMP